MVVKPSHERSNYRPDIQGLHGALPCRVSAVRGCVNTEVFTMFKIALEHSVAIEWNSTVF